MMNAMSLDSLLGPLEGTGELSVEQWAESPAANVSVTLNAQTLHIEVLLPKSHALYEYWLNNNDYQFVLHACTLHFCDPKLTDLDTYQLDEMQWSDRTPEYVKDEDFGSETAFARIFLRPAVSPIVLKGSKALDSARPYQVVYQDSGAFHVRGSSFPAECVAADIFAKQHGTKQMLQLYSSADFFAHERRLHAAWSLLQGGVMDRVLEVEGDTLRLYGGSAVGCTTNFPMIRHGDNQHLMEAIFAGFLSIKARCFKAIYEPLKMYLAGKALPTYVEVSFLMTMASIEALDHVRDLEEKTTAALLGVSSDFAKLCNCMRNKLIHGERGFQSAYRAVIQKDFHGKTAAGTAFLKSDGEFDARLFMTKIWERMDAFWGVVVNVSPAVINEGRSAHAILSSPVDLQAFVKAIHDVREDRRKRDGEKKRKEDRAKVERRMHLKTIERLRAELAECRGIIATHRQEQGPTH